MPLRTLFLNLPVRNLEASKAFFSALGFPFEARFTDEKAACMILAEGRAYVMLLTEPFFDDFTHVLPADAPPVEAAILRQSIRLASIALPPISR